ncbi:MAG TPA: trimeric intracellular cation channel family protein [Rubricoccaceae bacterium]
MTVPLDTLLYGLDLAGVAVFAASGALAAGRKHLDLFGVYVLAVVTSTGGGTLRDVLLDRHPVFWIADPSVFHVAIAAATATVAVARWGTPNPRLLRIADALGLGLFAVSGAQAAEATGISPVIVVVMGMMTGTFGGVIRDVLTGEIPLILRPGRLYATAAALGPAVYLGLKALGMAGAWAAAAGAAATIAVRFAAILFRIRLPVFILDVEPDDNI